MSKSFRFGRFAELNYVIRFKPEFLNQVLSGRKNITIRWGIVRPRFSELLITCNDLVYGIAEIEELKYVKLNEIPDSVIRKEGVKSKEELIKILKELYPEVKESDYVTLIKFKVKKIFRQPRKLIEVIKEVKNYD